MDRKNKVMLIAAIGAVAVLVASSVLRAAVSHGAQQEGGDGQPAIEQQAEEQEKMRVSSDLNDRAMAEFKKLIREGITEREVADQMLKIYEEYGYYKETQYAITLKGIDGSKQIAEMMDKLRNNPPKNFGELQVKELRDYDRDVITDLATGATRPTGLPKSNVLYFDLTNDSWCCARPSGTEPKIKFYMGVKGTSLQDAEEKLNKLTEDLKAVL